MHPSRSAVAGGAALLCLSGTVVALLAFGTGSGTGLAAGAAPSPSAWRGLVGAPRASVAPGQRVIVLLDAPSLADRVRAAGGVATDAQERRWAAATLAGQQQVLSEIAAKGVSAKPDLRFTRVLNGFSAIADPRAVVLLERAPEVAGVFPVRAAFPAAIATDESRLASPPPSGLAEYGGRGVTVALLDTAVDPATPFLHGHVLPGFDILSGGAAARYDQRPGGKRLEVHGTEVAGVVAGRGGPRRPSGVAPDATILPIRVAGWQRDAAGRWSIHARTDQVLAGLERAVDPNRDGDAHDAARIALVPLTEPFAAFADGPLARAVAGAVALDSLVVAPAGNDGPGGPVFGNIAGPGGAPAALTVGAVDMRRIATRVPVTVRAGLRVLLRRSLALLTPTPPDHEATIELVSVGKASPAAFFRPNGASRVAGRAVIVPTGASPRRTVALAARAGATVVLLSGAELPAGAFELDSTLAVPVLPVPSSLARAVREQRNDGTASWLSVGSARETVTAGPARPASFSSWGLGFGGQLEPDVSAPGVGVATAVPGADSDGRSRLVTMSGSSAAAAVAAGVAARLAQARPSLTAAELQDALAGTAHASAMFPVDGRGAGLIDGGKAATVEVVAEPSSLTFGRGGGDGWQRRELLLRNVSTRRLTVYLAPQVPRGSGVAVVLSPRKLRLEAGASARVGARARVVRLTGAPAVTGVLRVAPRGSLAVRVPWTIVLQPRPDDLIGEVQLSERSFEPSDVTPAVLAVRVGTIERSRGRDAVEPALRLDVVLRNAEGHSLGLLARLRDVLPGRYAFGLTGRNADGRLLAAGRYSLRLVAWPAAGGTAATRVVRFRVR
jgi:Subtilase family